MSTKITAQKISVFENVFPDAKRTSITLSDYFKKIHACLWQEEVLKWRSRKDKRTQDKVKKTVTCVTASGLFSGRDDKDLV